MTERARWACGWSSMALVRSCFALGLLASAACGRSGLQSEEVGRGAPEATGGSRGVSDAGAGMSGTGFSGTGGASSGGGAAGNAGSAGMRPVGGAGQGGSGGSSGSGGMAGNAGMAGSAGMAGRAAVVDRGVVVAWAEDRWVVATPTNDSRALAVYAVSELGELVSKAREIPIEEEPPNPLYLVDAVHSPVTGNVGILADSAFIEVTGGLDHAMLEESIRPSQCFVRRIEHVNELFVFVSVRPTFEGPITVLETPGVIDGNPGFYRKELTWLDVAGCRPLAFAPWVNSDGGVGVDFVYPLQNTQAASLGAARLYDRNGSIVGTAGLLPSPHAPDFNEPSRMDLVRIGTRSVASFRDLLENGTRYLLVDEFGFTVLDEVVQHIPLRLAAPMKGDDQGFVQAVVAEASPPRLELRELWTGDVPYSSRILAVGDIAAVHLARGSEAAFAVAFRAAPPAAPNGRVGALAPGLYLVGITRNEQLFHTKLPDL